MFTRARAGARRIYGQYLKRLLNRFRFRVDGGALGESAMAPKKKGREAAHPQGAAESGLSGQNGLSGPSRRPRPGTEVERERGLPWYNGLFPAPMLAKEYTERLAKKRVAFDPPLIVQPKLDGVRLVAWRDGDGAIRLTSRTGKPMDHLRPDVGAELEAILPAAAATTAAAKSVLVALDGELYAHGLGFQAIVSMVKNVGAPAHTRSRLRYHVYDAVFAAPQGTPAGPPSAPLKPSTLGYTERMRALEAAIPPGGDGHQRRVVLLRNDSGIPSHARTPADVEKAIEACVRRGYEGVMLRAPSSPYKLGMRSDDLLKYKRFRDAEFSIVGFKEAGGKDAGTVLWVCEVAPGGPTFVARPMGTQQHRRDLLDRAKEGGMVGKQLTVRFQEMTDNGIPRFPVGIEIRDYE